MLHCGFFVTGVTLIDAEQFASEPPAIAFRSETSQRVIRSEAENANVLVKFGPPIGSETTRAAPLKQFKVPPEVEVLVLVTDNSIG
jgi:hypothetical protein